MEIRFQKRTSTALILFLFSLNTLANTKTVYSPLWLSQKANLRLERPKSNENASGAYRPWVFKTAEYEYKKPVTAKCGVIDTIAGTGPWGDSGDGGPAVSATLDFPTGIAIDPVGNIFIRQAYKIRKIDAKGIITTLFAPDHGWISGMDVNSDGTLYITNNVRSGPFHYDLLQLDPMTGAARTITTLYALDTEPTGLTVDSDENIYITSMEKLFKIDSQGSISDISSVFYPRQIAFNGNIYVAEPHRILMITPSGSVTTIAGNGLPGFSGDGGPASEALLNYASGIAVDSYGNIFIADQGNGRIRQIDRNGTMTTIAGNGSLGPSDGDGGLATEATLGNLGNIALDADRNIYLAEGGRVEGYSNRVRKITTCF